MGRYLGRRLLIAVPTLIGTSFIIFSILELAPGSPTSQLPLTIPADVREQIRESLGFNEPFLVRYLLWAQHMFIHEPLHLLERLFGISIGDPAGRTRIISWTSRAPVVDVIIERLPQTLWIMGISLIIGTLIAIPVGVISARKQYSWFDNVGTFVTMVGYSLPTFFTGLLAIVIFSVHLGWFPSIYRTTHVVNDWSSFVFQLRQMAMPVGVLSLFNAAALSRFTRAAMLDNLNEDYVTTARAKGLTERAVFRDHALRNSLIPVVTLLALQVPGLFAGAIITEQIFRINGIGQLLISSIGQSDVPTVQTLAFVFAGLIIVFNLAADVVYGYLDPRIRF